MAEKRLIYFTSREVRAFHWRSGSLEADALFANDESGAAEFATYVAGSPHAIYCLLADLVEEDFHQETIPYVRGRDRQALLSRKLAQRYRDLSLALALSLGTEAGARREEKILFSSFTNTQQFQPWLAALRTHEARLLGVYSVALVSPLVGKRIGFTGKRYLLVSLQQGGLRQSYVENGQMRFSRLGRVDPDNPDEVARACAMESARLQQYLTNMRMLARDAGPIDAVVLAPAAQLDVFKRACADTAQLRFHVIDLDAACRGAGLKSAPEGLLGERLFLHVLATSQPSEQYVEDAQRRFYHLWRARVALFAAGAAVFVFCVLFAALRLVDIFNIDQLASIDRNQERTYAEQYARLQAQFPRTPTSAENLKAIVKNYRVLQRQNAPLDRLFMDLSKALALAPQIELERLDWHVGADPKRPGSGAAAKGAAPAKAPAAGAAAQAPDKGGGAASYEVIEISGRVNAAQASDYRNITLLVTQFVEALRRLPGTEVLSTQLPFDIAAEKSLSGDIGAQRAAEVPRFTVLVAKKLGT